MENYRCNYFGTIWCEADCNEDQVWTLDDIETMKDHPSRRTDYEEPVIIVSHDRFENIKKLLFTGDKE